MRIKQEWIKHRTRLNKLLMNSRRLNLPLPRPISIPVPVLILILLLFLLVTTIPQSLGMFSRVLKTYDSALAARFDVIITAPEEFISEKGENLFECHFITETDIRNYHFTIDNNGEVDVFCTPQISDGIEYKVYIGGESIKEIFVKAHESVNFQLLIAPSGLDTVIKDAWFFVDVEQIVEQW